MFRVVTENGKVIKDELNEKGANSLWNMYNGIYEDEDEDESREYRIYIEEYND